MKLSESLFRTWRETPEGAETRGIQFLLRAGYVRRVGSGLYAHLPLMTRVMGRLEALIREELEGVSQEVSFPVLQPRALWEASGRWEAYTQAEGIMFTVTDRSGRAHALGPTHEEVALDVVGEGRFRDARPTMGGEDFSAYLEKAPGAYFNVGSGSEEADSRWPHHHPRFTIDETSLETGVGMLRAAALRLARPE